MPPLAVLVAVLSLIVFDQPAPIEGRVVDARSGKAVARAEITIVGRRGSVRTDGDGRFRWPIAPEMPADVVVIMADGRAARPIQLASYDAGRDVTLVVDGGFDESVTVLGSSPTIDAAPGAARTLLTVRDLDLRHPPTLTQALDGVPGVGAISEGQAAVPAIRGLARGRTLILVDGSRATTERRAGANASFLDPGIAQTIEVARGPGSVAYGSDAFGGVIAVRTRRPDFGRPLEWRLAGTAGWSVPEQRGELEVSRGHGSGGVLIGVRAREFDDYDAPAGAVENSGWRDRGMRLRLEQMAGEGLWSIGWQSDFGRDLGRPRSDSDVILATSPYEDSHRLTASYERKSFGGFRNLRFDALAGASRQRTEQDRRPTPARPRSVERADLASRDLHVRLTGERLIGRARLHTGAEVQGEYGLEAVDTALAYNTAGVQTGINTFVSIDSAHRTAAGVFGETEVQVAPRLRLVGGLRGDAVRNTNAGGFFGDRSVSNAAVAGLVAATLAATRGLTLTAQLSRGFRDPTLSDRFYRGVVGRGFIEGNPTLKPEASRQFDLTARYVSAAFQLTAAGYHYRIIDLVERYAATPTTFLYRNRGVAILRGVEVEAHAPLAWGLTLSASAQTSLGRDGFDGTPLDDVAPAAASVTLRHALREWMGSYLAVKAIAAHSAAGPSEVATGGYTLAEAGISWRLSRQSELRGAIRNLLNESYQSSAGPRWVWAPRRHGSLTAVVRF